MSIVKMYSPQLNLPPLAGRTSVPVCHYDINLAADLPHGFEGCKILVKN